MTEVAFLDVAAGHQELRHELDAAYRAVLDGPGLVLGPQVAGFETEFAQHSGAAHCVGVGSGFDALTLGLRALGVGPGDDVLVPSNTYVATWLAVSALGARPVGVEPREGTGNLDPGRLDDACTPRTVAVVPVHLYGQPCELTAIRAWARGRALAVLADAAQAHGARHAGRPIGAQADAVAWSFYPSKNLGALGDGGAVTTDDASLADRVRLLRHYGSPARDVVTAHGVNSRLDELQAAFLRVKLTRLDEWNERRRANAARYLEALADLPLWLPEVAAGTEPVWHQFVVRVPRREAVRDALATSGIATMVHYPTPPFAQPAYAGLELGRETFPIARCLADEVLSLPVGPHLAEQQQERVIDALRSCLIGPAGHRLPDQQALPR